MAASFVVQGLDGCVDGAVERFVVGEGVVSQIVGLEIVPDNSMSLSSGAYWATTRR
jgi:hypothetical protein